MKVLITGVKGQLGHDMMIEGKKRGMECVGADIEEFDITDYDATYSFITKHQPDVVVHCSAFTAVDRAEEMVEVCEKVNADGPKNIATVCKELDIKMVYISTDYVFPGVGEQFYEVDDKKGPLSVYGKTKLQGEENVKSILEKYFIVRISWVFGINGNNFVKTMLRLSENHDTITVVNDQFGSPTYTADLVVLLADMIETEKYGTYHATNEGICAWSEFAQEIFKVAGKDTKVIPVTTEEYGAKAGRPANSRMSKKALEDAGFHRLPAWQDALKRYVPLIIDEN